MLRMPGARSRVHLNIDYNTPGMYIQTFNSSTIQRQLGTRFWFWRWCRYLGLTLAQRKDSFLKLDCVCGFWMLHQIQESQTLSMFCYSNLKLPNKWPLRRLIIMAETLALIIFDKQNWETWHQESGIRNLNSASLAIKTKTKRSLWTMCSKQLIRNWEFDRKLKIATEILILNFLENNLMKFDVWFHS